jgi:hypothetical protein
MNKHIGKKIAAGTDLAGLHALVIFPPSKKDRTKYLVSLLEAAKERWQWRISGICEDIDKRPFESLAGAKGRLFARPAQLHVEDWENDPAELGRVEQRLREAENAARVPVGSVILAGAHSVGRAYNVPFRYANRFPLVMRMLKDNQEPYKLVRRLFRFADETIADAKPDMVLAYEWATPLAFTIWLVAHLNGIPCISLRNSKINSDHGFWTGDRFMLNTVATEAAEAKRRAGASVSDAAQEHIRAFRDQPTMIKYIAVKWGDRTKRGFLRWHLEYARTLVREMINTVRGQDNALREPWIGRLLRYYRRIFFTVYHQQFMHRLDDETLASQKYVYFPMHKEAELAQTYQATFWHDQRNTIRVLASMLPFGYRLLVREHRLNFGNRPSRFYRQLQKIPNLVIIDPFESQFKYLRHADLVVTENGSSGWEGLKFGKRTLLLSQTFYKGTGRGVTVTDPDQINATILKMLSEPPLDDPKAHDHGVGCMIDADLEASFPMTKEGVPEALDNLGNAIAFEWGRRPAARAPAAMPE